MTNKLSDWLGKSIVACVDLEATCCDDSSFPRSDMEIIEIGITLVDTTTIPYTVVGSFAAFVRPVIHTTLTDFCKTLTTIEQADVDGADDWVPVAGQVASFFAQLTTAVPVIWVSWGDFDKNLIARECVKKSVGNPMPTPHFNLKAVDAAWRNTTKERGLRGAVAGLNLTFPGTLHRAVDDARAVAMILQTIGEGIKRSKV